MKHKKGSKKKKKGNKIKIKEEKEKAIIKKNECQECGSSNVSYNEKKDEIICRDCGAIFSKLIPTEEKRFEEAHEQK